MVVVTWNSAEVLPGFLASLASATSCDYELVVADNASAVAPTVPEGARLLSTGGNLGYGAAANLAAAGARTPWLLVANPDLTFRPGALDVLLGAAGRWPRAGVLGPGILTPDGRLYPSARALPSLGRGIGHALLGWWWPANPFTRAYRCEAGPPREGPAGWLSGSCLLLRREAFEAVGGFDPAYFMYCEDMDLCERLARAGWQVVYVPSAVVTHQGGHATRQAAREMLRAHHDSVYRYLARRHRRLAPALRLGLGLRYRASLVIGRLGAGAQPRRSGEELPAPAGPAAPAR